MTYDICADRSIDMTHVLRGRDNYVGNSTRMIDRNQLSRCSYILIAIYLRINVGPLHVNASRRGIADVETDFWVACRSFIRNPCLMTQPMWFTVFWHATGMMCDRWYAMRLQWLIFEGCRQTDGSKLLQLWKDSSHAKVTRWFPTIDARILNNATYELSSSFFDLNWSHS